LYWGFIEKQTSCSKYQIAEPEKALLDWIYLNLQAGLKPNLVLHTPITAFGSYYGKGWKTIYDMCGVVRAARNDFSAFKIQYPKTREPLQFLLQSYPTATSDYGVGLTKSHLEKLFENPFCVGRFY
jgi:hypothetical protein